MTSTPKAKLEPLTIAITDQRTLKRIHKTANLCGTKPENHAKMILHCGSRPL